MTTEPSKATHGLAGLRVLDLGTMVAAPYAAKLLGDLGADVIKVEPLDGDPSRWRGPFPIGDMGDPEQSGLFLGLNTNKRGVAIDIDSDAGRARLDELVGSCDIVFHSFSAARALALGLDGDELLAAYPHLVVCAITPFGHSGPHAEWRAEEINIVHGGGWGWLIPGDAVDPQLPPLTVFGHPANCQAGMAGALAALAAWDKSDRTGVGEYVDMSAMANVGATLEAAFSAWAYRGELAHRVGGRILTPWKILPCSDGLIFLVTVEQDQWERLVSFMGDPEWAHMEVFSTVEARAENQDVMYHFLEEWTKQHSVDELFHGGQAERICFAPVYRMSDLDGQPHLVERGFFHEVDHPVAGPVRHLGSPSLATPSAWELRRAAPTLDEHHGAAFGANTSRRVPPQVDAIDARPLDGVRVVDFSWVWAGPYATMHLAFLGAEVVKVESSNRPSLGRRLPLHPTDVEPSLNTCGYFNQWDQGKKSVELDLTTDEGAANARQLIATADVVVDNYATGVMDRLGLSDAALRSINPDLIITSITGFGHSGPLREYMGYGPTTAPLSGLTSLTGHPGGRPEEAGISFGDPAAGMAAAFATVAALVQRRRGDGPTRIDASLWEATAVNAIEAWMTHALGAEDHGPIGNRSLVACPHGVFRCSGDDDWVSIACMSDDEWRLLAGLVGGAALDKGFASFADRKADEEAVERMLTEWTKQRTKWEVTSALQAVGVAAYPSLDCQEIEVNPQFAARNFWERLDHPEVGVRTQSGIAWRYRNAPNGVLHRAPLIGEHSEEILSSLIEQQPARDQP